MDWKKKTVSMGLVDQEEFDLELATVTVSDNRIVVDPHDVEDWARIFDELGADTVLEEVRWEDVEAVDKSVNELYYPHVNIQLAPAEDDDFQQPREKRIYFTEDEQETLQRCFNTILRFWNKWRQHNAIEDKRFPNELDDENGEEVELEDALREQRRDRLHEELQARNTAEPEEIRAEQSDVEDQDGSKSGEEDSTTATTADETADDADDEMDEDTDTGPEDTGDDEHGEEDNEVDDIVDRFMDQD